MELRAVPPPIPVPPPLLSGRNGDVEFGRDDKGARVGELFGDGSYAGGSVPSGLTLHT